MPVAGWVDASVEIHQQPTGLTVPHPSQDLPAQLVAIECRTAGTELDHMDGWILFMAAHTDDHVQAEAVGRLSAVRLRGGIVCLGKPGRSMTRGRWDVATPLGVIRAADVEWAKPVLLVCP